MPSILEALTARPQPNQTGPNGPLDWLQRLYSQTLGKRTPESEAFAKEVKGDPGLLETLGPDVAGLGVFGAVRKPATNIAKELGFLRRIFGDAPAEDVSRALFDARSPSSIDAGHEASRVLRRSADATGFDRSGLLGAANLSESPEGRAFLEIADLYGDMGPVRATRFADQAAIETLLESLPPVIR